MTGGSRQAGILYIQSQSQTHICESLISGEIRCCCSWPHVFLHCHLKIWGAWSFGLDWILHKSSGQLLMLWSPGWEGTADRLSPLKCEEHLSVPHHGFTLTPPQSSPVHCSTLSISDCGLWCGFTPQMNNGQVLGSGDFKTLQGGAHMYLWWEEERKEQTQQRPISHFMSSLSAPVRFPAPPLLQPLISTHSLVFYHTFLHLNFTNPIYCYLYPWLLLSLLLLSLLLWLESLSSCALFSIFYKV